MGGQPPQSRSAGPTGASASPASAWGTVRDHFFAFSLIFTGLFVTHATLLRLPYFWDEAGYFIPAARDVLLNGSLIPHSTLSNAHPPMVMLWLAFWWKCSGYTPAVTRTAMLLVTAFALLGVWRLARRVANDQVAIATVVCTALYPVFFAQSTLAHLDMMACAFTIWGLAMYVERRPVATVVFLALVPLVKETAVITPMALLGWEVVCPLLARVPRLGKELCFQKRSWLRTLSLLLCVVPLILWLSYHHHKTGYFLGNPEYLRYNLGSTLTPQRVVMALRIRLWHVLAHLNMFVLTLVTAFALSQPALTERDGSERQRIAIPVQLVFIVVIAAHIVALSIVGGALLVRYLLPEMPLLILLCVATLRRRMRQWVWSVAAVCGAFVFALLIPPPYSIAPEDTLLYRDFIVLHAKAESEIAKRYPDARVLTTWPASDEMTQPFLGYVKQPMNVVRVENFSEEEMERVAGAPRIFDIVFLFSDKWEPARRLIPDTSSGQALHKRYFDYHTDVTPERAAEMLGGRIVFYENRNNEWVAIIAIERVEDAERLKSHASSFK